MIKCILNIFKSLDEITKYIDEKLESVINYEILANMQFDSNEYYEIKKFIIEWILIVKLL